MGKILIFVISTCSGLTFIIGFGMQCLIRKYAIDMICNHPELSNKKVIAITKMLCKFKFPKYKD